jgi:hypothetical protein
MIVSKHQGEVLGQHPQEADMLVLSWSIWMKRIEQGQETRRDRVSNQRECAVCCTMLTKCDCEGERKAGETSKICRTFETKSLNSQNEIVRMNVVNDYEICIEVEVA